MPRVVYTDYHHGLYWHLDNNSTLLRADDRDLSGSREDVRTFITEMGTPVLHLIKRINLPLGDWPADHFWGYLSPAQQEYFQRRADLNWQRPYVEKINSRLSYLHMTAKGLSEQHIRRQAQFFEEELEREAQQAGHLFNSVPIEDMIVVRIDFWSVAAIPAAIWNAKLDALDEHFYLEPSPQVEAPAGTFVFKMFTATSKKKSREWISDLSKIVVDGTILLNGSTEMAGSGESLNTERQRPWWHHLLGAPEVQEKMEQLVDDILQGAAWIDALPMRNRAPFFLLDQQHKVVRIFMDDRWRAASFLQAFHSHLEDWIRSPRFAFDTLALIPSPRLDRMRNTLGNLERVFERLGARPHRGFTMIGPVRLRLGRGRQSQMNDAIISRLANCEPGAIDYVHRLQVHRGRPDWNPPSQSACPGCFRTTANAIEDDEIRPFVCGHYVCRFCLPRHLFDRQGVVMHCMVCDYEPSLFEIDVLLLNAMAVPSDYARIYRRYVEMLCQRYQETRVDMASPCPTPNCTKWVARNRTEGERDRGTCGGCEWSLCFACGRHSHAQVDCATVPRDPIPSDNVNIAICPGVIARLDDRPCGAALRCGRTNHVVCGSCRSHICWTCNQTFENDRLVYKHLRDKHSRATDRQGLYTGITTWLPPSTVNQIFSGSLRLLGQSAILFDAPSPPPLMRAPQPPIPPAHPPPQRWSTKAFPRLAPPPPPPPGGLSPRSARNQRSDRRSIISDETSNWNQNVRFEQSLAHRFVVHLERRTRRRLSDTLRTPSSGSSGQMDVDEPEEVESDGGDDDQMDQDDD